MISEWLRTMSGGSSTGVFNYNAAYLANWRTARDNAKSWTLDALHLINAGYADCAAAMFSVLSL